MTIARVGAPHGLFGHLKLQVFLEDPDHIYDFKFFFLKLPHEKEFKPFQSFVITEKGGGFYIQFPPLTDRDQVRIYTHSELAVERSALPTLPADHFYWSDLIGLQVLNQAGQILGKVDSLMETGANDVLVIKKEGGAETLIPYVYPQIVKKVNLQDRALEVDWEADESCA